MLYSMGLKRVEIKDEGKKLFEYCTPQKNLNKAYIENFLFDLKNIIVLRLFASDNYVLIMREGVKSISQLADDIKFEDFKDKKLS